MIERTSIENWFEAHWEEYLRDLAALVAVPSVKGKAAPGAPFGQEPAKALNLALAIAEGYGFRVTNDEGYVGLVDYCDSPARLDILAHLDVVPEGEGWTVTEPYQMKRQDGWLYGRGTADDKGPALAALYAMRCLRELGVQLAGNCRLILGTDEECGSQDIAHYYARNPEAPMSFSPDAEYPVINVEKGRYAGTAAVPALEGECGPLVSIRAGIAANVVPGKARCTLRGLSEELVARQAEIVSRETGVSMTVTREGETLSLLAQGEQAHASTPEVGNNALTALLALLCALPLGEGRLARSLSALNALFPHGDTSGEAAGIAWQDDSGALTLCLSVLRMEDGTLEAEWDSRVPVTEPEERIRLLEKRLWEAGFTVSSQWSGPHAVPEDGTLVQTLLRRYEEYTGRKGTCIAIGGGTYVHHLKNGVAFGCAFPGTENRMHGADERAAEEELLLSGKLFAAVIAELCG